MSQENTYESDKSWRRLQRYLPKRNRLTKSSLPAEEYLTVGKFRVHVDHYRPDLPLVISLSGFDRVFEGVLGMGTQYPSGHSSFTWRGQTV